VSYSVLILVPGQVSVSEAVKMGPPAAESANVVFRELYAGAPPDYVDDEDGSEWYKLDAATCRERIPEAVRSAIPDGRWDDGEWRQAVADGFEELAQALERVEGRTGEPPVISESY
jgi:hypothetical protein